MGTRVVEHRIRRSRIGATHSPGARAYRASAVTQENDPSCGRTDRSLWLAEGSPGDRQLGRTRADRSDRDPQLVTARTAAGNAHARAARPDSIAPLTSERCQVGTMAQSRRPARLSV